MHSVPSIVLVSLAALTSAQFDSALVGTWTTKSKAVLTGSVFYNPVEDKLIEPSLTGISYSFTSDGFYEEAYYRAISNPTTPACPSALMQWQHGSATLPGNGSIILTPISVDGRQLTSAPCSYDNAIYERYIQPEYFQSYAISTDPYHNIPRLDLYQFNGAPLQPLYLAMTPPQMLPTSTLNPTSTSTGAPAATAKSRVKRGLHADEHEGMEEMQKVMASGKKGNAVQKPFDPFHPDTWWWTGFGLIGVGTVMFMMPTSKKA